MSRDSTTNGYLQGAKLEAQKAEAALCGLSLARQLAGSLGRRVAWHALSQARAVNQSSF